MLLVGEAVCGLKSLYVCGAGGPHTDSSAHMCTVLQPWIIFCKICVLTLKTVLPALEFSVRLVYVGRFVSTGGSLTSVMTMKT